MSEDVIRKIQGLFALAENNDNQNQAEIAMAKAYELMTKYNIEQSQLNKKDNEYLKIKTHEWNKRPIEHPFVWSIVDEFFNVALIRGNSQNKGLEMVGTKENIEIAKYVYDFLVLTYKKLFKRATLLNGLRTTEKQAFYDGVWRGLKAKLEKEKKNIEETMALVIVRDPGIDQAVNQFYKKLVAGNFKFTKSEEATNLGFDAGQKININPALQSSNNQHLQLN